MSKHPLDEVLHPNSIAVAGASPGGRGMGFIAPLMELGFKGRIYGVNPKYAGQDIMGHRCYASVRDIPDTVDFVISSIPATQVLNLVDDCATKGVKGIHFFTARFSETGRKDAADLEKELLRRAKAAGIRIIGPNCMGVYYPAWGISFSGGMPKTSGPLSALSQSGSVTHEIVDYARRRGMYFSKAISYGNAIDFNESDYLEYYGQDENTKIILAYIEGVRDGERFFRTLREITLRKPVVIIKGGRGSAGTRATASHTASLAGAMQIWHTAVRQAGAVEVATIEELIDVAAAFYFAPPVMRNHVGVAGGSGGSSVMAADQCEEAGLNVVALPDEIRQELKRRGSAIWDWVSNPADFSISMGDFNSGEIMKLMADHPDFDLLIMFQSPPWHGHRGRFPMNFSMDDLIKRSGIDDIKKPMFIVYGDRGRTDEDPSGEGRKAYNDMKQALLNRNLPLYGSIGTAANAAAKAIWYYNNRRRAMEAICQ